MLESVQRETIYIPASLRSQKHRIGSMYRARYCRKRVLIDEIYKWGLLDHNLLHSVECFLAFLEIRGSSLQAHQTVDLRFPCCFRTLLLRIPLVILGRTEPDIHFFIWIQADVGQPEKDGFVIESLRHPLDQRREIEGHNVHLDPDSLQVFLNHGRHPLAISIS